MKLPVLVGAVLASLLLAVINNLVNPDAVAWIGSAEVLPKPEGWPTLSAWQGIAAGVKVGWKFFLAHTPAVLGVLIGVPLLALSLKRLRGADPTKVLLTAFRIGFAIMFLEAAWGKFLDPEDFSLLVTQYQFLPLPLVNGFSLWLASFEIVVALGIILTPWEKEFSALVGLMMVMFIIALAQALGRGLGIACGCFDINGAADAGETWFSLVRDVVLMVPIAWMVLRGGRRWIWQFRPGA
jgi:uncharacterized membrane protein YphA (DoxX/SURF4 family)